MEAGICGLLPSTSPLSNKLLTSGGFITTILVMRKEGRILADSRSVWGNVRVSTTRKIFRVRGGLVCGAGNLQACFACFRFIEEGANAKPEAPYVPQDGPCNDNSFTVLWLRADRSLWLYGDHFEPTPVLDDVYAIGTGEDIARTALHLGKTPEEAMELACELDFNSGPPVVVEKL